MSVTIRRQHSQASAGYNGTSGISQPQAAQATKTAQQKPQAAAPKQKATAQSSFTKYNKDASKASLGKQNAAKKDGTQAIADKALELFGAGSTLGLTALQFSETMRVMKQFGIVNKPIAKALHEVFGLIKTGTSKSAIQAKLAALGKDFGKIGGVMTVLSGVLSIANSLQKGDYKGALKDLYSTAAGLVFKGPSVAYNALLSVMRIAIPGFKGSPIDKVLNNVDIIAMGKVGIDVIAEGAKQFVHFCKHGTIDAASLKRLGEQLRKGGTEYLAKIGEYLGEKMYDVLGHKVGKEFAELWLVLNDPNTRITPSESGKISAVMNKLCEQMNSPNPTIRKRATRMAQETLQKLIARSKTDPRCRKGLATWYGYVRSTGSQGYGKYRALLKQSPGQIQSIHTQWRNGSNWFVRLFQSKQAPQIP